MLKLSTSESAENFRKEFKGWLGKNPPPSANPESNLDSFIKTGREWQEKLAAGNWVAVHWPKEFGGRGLSLLEEAIVQEELSRVFSPQLLGLFGLTMVGPVLIQYGTKDQKEKYLKNILTCKDIWCQGFSEPGAGSDLAALKTRAERKEGGFLVSGQKVWTSFAQIADYCFLLCRTSNEIKKHQGMSYLLVDMKSKGVSVKPLKQISGDLEFNEVFFDNVFVPQENILGEIGSGWKIAISTLMYERVILTFARMLQSEVALRVLSGAHKDDSKTHLKQRLSALIAKSSAVRALAYQHLEVYANGGTPGPEGSLDKLLWSESFQEIAKLSLAFMGQDAAFNENHPGSGQAVHQYLYSRGRTIAAGTSEIQRNIIAERILGLGKS